MTGTCKGEGSEGKVWEWKSRKNGMEWKEGKGREIIIGSVKNGRRCAVKGMNESKEGRN